MITWSLMGVRLQSSVLASLAPTIAAVRVGKNAIPSKVRMTCATLSGVVRRTLVTAAPATSRSASYSASGQE